MPDLGEISAHQTQLQLSNAVFHMWALFNKLLFFIILFFYFFSSPFYRFFPLSLTWPRAGQAAPSGAEPTRLSRFYRPCCQHFCLESDCSNSKLRKIGFDTPQNYFFSFLALGKQRNSLQRDSSESTTLLTMVSPCDKSKPNTTHCFD